MASEFFARKLNLELALNPLFHGPHEELMEETPPAKEVKVPKRKDHKQCATRIHSGNNTGSQSKFATGSHINSFEFKNRNPKGVYDFLQVKMDRENARTKTTKIRKVTKVKKVDETETGNRDNTEAGSVIVEVEPDFKSTERTSAKSVNTCTNDKREMKSVNPETGSGKPGIVPEILHYSDEFSEGPLEVYEPVFVRFPVWKPAKLNHSAKNEIPTLGMSINGRHG